MGLKESREDEIFKAESENKKRKTKKKNCAWGFIYSRQQPGRCDGHTKKEKKNESGSQKLVRPTERFGTRRNNPQLCFMYIIYSFF